MKEKCVCVEWEGERERERKREKEREREREREREEERGRDRGMACESVCVRSRTPVTFCTTSSLNVEVVNFFFLRQNKLECFAAFIFNFFCA